MRIRTRCEINDVLSAVADAPHKVEQAFEAMGEDAVGYAREHGNYHDRTGNLRHNTHYEADREHLRVENSMPYASYVEHRGYEVLSSAEDYIHDKYKLR